MRYQYTYRNTGLELWQLSMYHIYGSVAGVCNLVFTAAVFTLALVKWHAAGLGFRVLLVLACCLFPVIQPMLAYGRAKKQANGIVHDSQISFNDEGVDITFGEQSSAVKWEQIRRISKKPGMMIIYTDTTHGFVLTDRVLGKDKGALYEYVSSRIREHEGRAQV